MNIASIYFIILFVCLVQLNESTSDGTETTAMLSDNGKTLQEEMNLHNVTNIDNREKHGESTLETTDQISESGRLSKTSKPITTKPSVEQVFISPLLTALVGAQPDSAIPVTSLNSTTSPKEPRPTPTSTEFAHYVTQQFIYIADHVLRTSYDFLYEILKSDIFLQHRDKLEWYAEEFLNLTNNTKRDDYIKDGIYYNGQRDYELGRKKLLFLKRKGTLQFERYLSVDRIQSYKDYQREISIWLDQKSEAMRREFNTRFNILYNWEKSLYYNLIFNIVQRVDTMRDKLWSLGEVVKAVVKDYKSLNLREQIIDPDATDLL